MDQNRIKIRLCMGSSCFSRGNDRILNLVKSFLDKNQLYEQVDFRGHLCKGKCNKGPNISIGDKEYHQISESSIRLILQEALEPLLPNNNNKEYSIRRS